MSLPVPTEAVEAKMLMQYFRLMGYMFTHIKNETGRPQAGRYVRNWKAVWDHKDGVRPGFPDFIVIAKNQVLAIELKRTKNSKTSPEQVAWIQAFNDAGTPAAICKGAEQAIAFIESVVAQR